MVGCQERSGTDAHERLDIMGVATVERGAVVDDQRPGQVRGGQRALLRVRGATGERDHLPDHPFRLRRRRDDRRRRRGVAGGDGDGRHRERVGRIGHAQRNVVGLGERVGEGRGDRVGVAIHAIAVEIPRVAESVAIGIMRARAIQVDRQGCRTVGHIGRHRGHRWLVGAEVLDALEHAVVVIDVEQVTARPDLDVGRSAGIADEGLAERRVGQPVGAGRHDPDALARVIGHEERVLVLDRVVALAIEGQAGDRGTRGRAGVAREDVRRVVLVRDVRRRDRVRRLIELLADVDVHEVPRRLDGRALVARPTEVLHR